jgi:ubiquinone/menaquinone biosynthesis C-methylase UbiE
LGLKLRLLPRRVLVKTGPVDHADWNFRPLLSFIQRRRFRIVLSLLGENRFQRLLEIGYGSGVFMPELARRCEELYGIDIHPNHESVAASLATLHINARLFSASAEATPFPNSFFDCLVAVSSLEFIEDLDRACAEFRRILRPKGALVVVTPGYSRLADWGLKVLTGEDPKRNFGDRRERVIPTLAKYFSMERQVVYPPFEYSLISLYRGLKLYATQAQ